MREESEQGMQPCLICYDQAKDTFWAIGVDAKGATVTTVKWMGEKLDDSGYRGEHVTMKSDNEEAIIALQKATAAMISGQTVLIHSPVRSSKSNGRMENAVRRWQGQLRTIKHFVESRLKCKIPADSALCSWLIPFCVEIMSKFVVGEDGRTGYERLTRHRCNHFIIGFGETVYFKLEPEKNNRYKADS